MIASSHRQCHGTTDALCPTVAQAHQEYERRLREELEIKQQKEQEIAELVRLSLQQAVLAACTVGCGSRSGLIELWRGVLMLKQHNIGFKRQANMLCFAAATPISCAVHATGWEHT